MAPGTPRKVLKYSEQKEVEFQLVLWTSTSHAHFCLSIAIASLPIKIMILLPGDLIPWSLAHLQLDKCGFKSYLPQKKISLSWITRQHVF